MLPRRILPFVREALADQAAVGLIGPRQEGKTTRSLWLAEERPSGLESREDRRKLADPELFLHNHDDRLVILDDS